jgi:thioredoxin 1
MKTTKSKLIEVDETNFEAEVLRSTTPVVMAFTSDNCGPCRLLKPFLEALANDLGSAKFVTVDVEVNERLVRGHGINAVPSLLVFRQGKEVDRMVGLGGLVRLREALGI